TFYSQLSISPDNLAAINTALLSGISVRIEQGVTEVLSTDSNQYTGSYVLLAANVSTSALIGSTQTYDDMFDGEPNGDISTTNFIYQPTGSAGVIQNFIPAGTNNLPSFTIHPAPTSPVFTAKVGKSVKIPVITSPATPPISYFNLSPLWTGNKSAAGYTFGECLITDPLLTEINNALIDGTTVLISSLFVSSASTPGFLDFEVAAYNSSTQQAIGLPQKLASSNVTSFIPAGAVYTSANSGYVGAAGSATVAVNSIPAGQSLELIPQIIPTIDISVPAMQGVFQSLFLNVTFKNNPSAQFPITGDLLTEINTALGANTPVSISYELTSENITIASAGASSGPLSLPNNCGAFVSSNFSYLLNLLGAQVSTMQNCTILNVSTIDVNTLTIPSASLENLWLYPNWTLGTGDNGPTNATCTLSGTPLFTAINTALAAGTTVNIWLQCTPGSSGQSFVVNAYDPLLNVQIGSSHTFPGILASGDTWSLTTGIYQSAANPATPTITYKETPLPSSIVPNQILQIIPTIASANPAAPVAPAVLKLSDSSTLTGLWISIIGTPGIQLNCAVGNQLFGQILKALQSGNHVTLSPAFSGSTVTLTAQEIISSAVTNPIGTQTYSTLPAGLTASSWTSSSVTYQYTTSAGTPTTGPLVPLSLNQPLEIVQAPTAATNKTKILQLLSVNPVWTGKPDPSTGKMYAKCQIGAALMAKINATLAKKQNVYITSSISGSNFIVTANTYDINTATGYLPFGSQAFDNVIPSGSKWTYSNFQSQFTKNSQVNTNNANTSNNALGIYTNKTIKTYQWPNLSKAK
ncbi:MAG: hypothetical protein NTU89_04355, partial [Candidatus Dependentiae bacterium]|nr:hypothetical protein [Candidatus Dependentiae bacterium]